MNAQRGQRIVRRADRALVHACAHACMLPCMLALAATINTASLADGGIVVWTGERMGARAAVIIAPAAPSVDEVEFAWIGAWKAGALVHAQHLDGLAIEGVLAPALIGSEVRCSLALTKVGHWDITIDPDGNGDAQFVSSTRWRVGDCGTCTILHGRGQYTDVVFDEMSNAKIPFLQKRDCFRRLEYEGL